MGLVNASVPRAQLRAEVESLARELLEKNPVVLRAAKLGYKHCGAMSWDAGGGLPLREARAVAVPRRRARPRAGPRAVPRREADQAGPAGLRAADAAPERGAAGSATSSAASSAVLRRRLAAAIEPAGLTLPAYTALSVLRAQDGLSERTARPPLARHAPVDERGARAARRAGLRAAPRGPAPRPHHPHRADEGGEPSARALRPRRRRGRAGDAGRASTPHEAARPPQRSDQL